MKWSNSGSNIVRKTRCCKEPTIYKLKQSWSCRNSQRQNMIWRLCAKLKISFRLTTRKAKLISSSPYLWDRKTKERHKSVRFKTSRRSHAWRMNWVTCLRIQRSLNVWVGRSLMNSSALLSRWFSYRRSAEDKTILSLYSPVRYKT